MPHTSRLLRTLAILLVGCALGACSGKRGVVSENLCRAGDWQTLGYRDGVEGKRSTRLLAVQEACGEFGILPDRETYLLGWREGIRDYCRPDHGWDLGVSGAGYGNVCPEELEPRFLGAYDAGRELFEARRACAEAEDSIAHLEARRTQIEDELLRSGTRQLDPLLTPSQRVELASAAKRLVDERIAIEHQLPVLEKELAARRAELAALEQMPAAPAD